MRRNKIQFKEPAFPSRVYNLCEDGSEQIAEHTWHHIGLTKREYIAIQAMQSMIASGWIEGYQDARIPKMVQNAWHIADEMLKARESK